MRSNMRGNSVTFQFGPAMAGFARLKNLRDCVEAYLMDVPRKRSQTIDADSAVVANKAASDSATGYGQQLMAKSVIAEKDRFWVETSWWYTLASDAI